MDYTFNYGGMAYDLPKYTKSVKNKMDQINKDNAGNLPDEKKYRNMYLFVREMLGEDATKEIFGTDSLDEIDLNEILVCYLGIAHAYSKPVDEAKKNMQDEVSDEDKELLLSILKNSGNLAALEKSLKSGKVTSFPLASRGL